MAILIDGEYMKKTLSRRLRRFPELQEILNEVHRVIGALHEPAIYRIFYYTADPLTGTAKNPLNGEPTNFAATKNFRNNQKLIAALERTPDVAVRRGALERRGWELKPHVEGQLVAGEKSELEADDLKPKIVQKGVDMRIGLDIASLALKKLVPAIAVVSGDTDLVPAFKFARREGLRVYLDMLGASGRDELRCHADRVLE